MLNWKKPCFLTVTIYRFYINTYWNFIAPKPKRRFEGRVIIFVLTNEATSSSNEIASLVPHVCVSLIVVQVKITDVLKALYNTRMFAPESAATLQRVANILQPWCRILFESGNCSLWSLKIIIAVTFKRNKYGCI